MSLHRPEIFVYRRWKLRVALVLLLVTALVGGGLLYRQGLQAGGADWQRLRQRLAAAEGRAQALAARNARLERQLAMLQQARRVDHEALAALRKERTRTDARLQALRKEVGFYRSVMNPGSAHKGLALRDIELLRAGDGGYRLRFVLTQGRPARGRTSGRLQLTLLGRQAGQARALPLPAPRVKTRRGSAGLAYRFRYYQEISWPFALPADFQPRQLRLVAVPAAGGRKRAQTWTYDWEAILVRDTEEG